MEKVEQQEESSGDWKMDAFIDVLFSGLIFIVIIPSIVVNVFFGGFFKHGSTSELYPGITKLATIVLVPSLIVLLTYFGKQTSRKKVIRRRARMAQWLALLIASFLLWIHTPYFTDFAQQLRF